MKLYLIRHPRAHPSDSNRCVGQTDLSLSGCSEEERLRWEDEAAAVRPECIIASDLQRCCEPARSVAARLNVPLYIDARWRELDFGTWENRCWDEIYREDPSTFDRWAFDFIGNHPPHGESFDSLQRRTIEALDEAATAVRSPVLIVTHASPIRAVLCRVKGVSVEESFLWQVPHGSPIHCEVKENEVAPGKVESQDLRRLQAADPV